MTSQQTQMTVNSIEIVVREQYTDGVVGYAIVERVGKGNYRREQYTRLRNGIGDYCTCHGGWHPRCAHVEALEKVEAEYQSH